MKHFEGYVSNTIASSANQMIFGSNLDTSRVFFKITKGGKYNYSLIFTNTIDSTYARGEHCQKNVICSAWDILEAKTTRVCTDICFLNQEQLNELNNSLENFKTLTFGGSKTMHVEPAQVFACDEFEMEFEAGDYLCLELTYKGEVMPYHEESIIPICKKTDTSWHLHKKMPLPAMVGIKREVKTKIGFIGDSITQGIGVPFNHYTHWNAVVASKLGNDFAFWNLGIGFGRANDIGTLGAWYKKALQNDVLVVCYGVNDIMQGFDKEQIKTDITTTVLDLKKNGKKVILQTIPPFDYNEEQRVKWDEINAYIKTDLAKVVDMVFDAASYLGKSEKEPHLAKFGGHPNEQGCAIWGNALYEAIKDIL